MQKDLFTMERAIALNIYQSRQARYRGLDIVTGNHMLICYTHLVHNCPKLLCVLAGCLFY